MNRSLHHLHYARPAGTSNEALPLGNGRIGALCLGEPGRTLLRVNDSTAWSGSPLAELLPPVVDAVDAQRSLAEARAAILADNPAAAVAPLKRLQHRHVQTFLPFVDLHVRIDPDGAGRSNSSTPATAYRRALDLQTATHTVEYDLDGTRVRERTFVTAVHGVLVHHVEADAPVTITVDLTSQLRVVGIDDETDGAGLRLRLPSDVFPPGADEPDPIRYDVRPGQALDAAAVFSVTHDGVSSPGVPGAGDTSATGTWSARGVRRATVYLATQTTFAGIGQLPAGDALTARAEACARLRDARAVDDVQLESDHQTEHRRLYDRTELTLEPSSEIDGDTPSDDLLAAANREPGGPLAHSPWLVGLLFHYGRYLLISSSRPGGTPANLQGIWNDTMRPPWSSNYTINVNTEMNYWGAESVGLRECSDPVLDLVDALSRSGRGPAEVIFGARGWAAHHNTDAWAYPWPVGHGENKAAWSFGPLSGAWLAHQYAERLDFGTDRALRERAWPAVHGAAQFVLDRLESTSDGTLGVVPSTSPENEFVAADGSYVSATHSSAFDLVVAADTLATLVRLADDLARADDSVVVEAHSALATIRGPWRTRDGRVGEWLGDPLEVELDHRHLSHLAFAFPSGWPHADELADAVSRSLDVRGDESTGWSLVWKLALRARLYQPQNVEALLALVLRDARTDRGLFSGGLYPNFLAAHPPFQIDGNLGFVAGLAECLVQSHRGAVELLPAVPSAISHGAVHGLVARPGVSVDVRWEPHPDGSVALVDARVGALPDRPAPSSVTLRYRGVDLVVALDSGPVAVKAANFDAPNH